MMYARAKIPAQTSMARISDSPIRRKSSDSYKSANSPVSQIIYLQRTIGNQAAKELFKSGAIQINLQDGKPSGNNQRS